VSEIGAPCDQSGYWSTVSGPETDVCVRVTDVRHRVDGEYAIVIAQKILVHQIDVSKHLVRRAGRKTPGRAPRLLNQRCESLARVAGDRQLAHQVPVHRFAKRRELPGRDRPLKQLPENIGDGFEHLGSSPIGRGVPGTARLVNSARCALVRRKREQLHSATATPGAQRGRLLLRCSGELL
jgi:hypothetical protein